MAELMLDSADTHIVEPPDLWTERIDRKFRDRAPEIRRLDNGSDWWFADDILVTSPFSGTQTGMRFVDPEHITINVEIADLREGSHIPDAMVTDLDADGVRIAVLYPTTGVAMMRLPDTELVTAIARAYNDWLAEFCAAHPDRLKGLAVILTDDVEAGARELERCVGLGLVGGTIPIRPLPDMPYDSPDYDRLWATAEALGVPLTMHISSQRNPPAAPGQEKTVSLLTTKGRFGTAANDALMRDSLTEMVYGGVFERFPGLRVGSVECEIGWAPFWLVRMDHSYTLMPAQVARRFSEGRLPSDVVRDHVFFSFLEDRIGIRLRDIIGVDNLVWGSDYPHVESTWPKSRELLEERILEGCSADEKHKITSANVRRIYRLDHD
jgi:predicted TIM-barrel fold metal-dependent hydrolase